MFIVYTTINEKFTIHFATINTYPLHYQKPLQPEFTIHFATINTAYAELISFLKSAFTIHFATINTEESKWETEPILHLQYTLLLLIQ